MASFYFCLIRIRNQVATSRSRVERLNEVDFFIFGQSYVNCIFIHIINDVNHDCRPVKVENKCLLIWVSFNSTRKRNGNEKKKNKDNAQSRPTLRSESNIFSVFFFIIISGNCSEWVNRLLSFEFEIDWRNLNSSQISVSNHFQGTSVNVASKWSARLWYHHTITGTPIYIF